MNDLKEAFEINIMEKVEVWYQENYDLLKGEFENMYFHKSFDSDNEAVEYIQMSLDAEIHEFKKLDEKASNEELLSRYRMFGTDYFLKNSKIGFSSWHYVEQKCKDNL
jgi:hypothetical protein